MQTATVSAILDTPSTSYSTSQCSAAEAARLGEQITELCSYLYAAEAKLLALIREFDEKKGWAEQGFYSCAHWLNFKCGIGINAAREKVRVARALVELPETSARLAKGELSYSKVRAMTRVATPENEGALLNIARHGTAHHVEKLVAKYRSAKRAQAAALAEEQYRDRELSHYYDHDGCLVIKARLPAEQGAMIIKALEMALEPNFPAAEEGKADTDDASASGQQPVAARRADALARIAEAYLGNDAHTGSTADRYQVVVHVTAETSEIEGGPHVTAETSRRIGCDSTIVRVTDDDNGEPLSIGRRSRTIPPAIRRALRRRDGGCRFPGCTHTRFVDGHHIVHWADNGETSLDNLVLLCRHHHHLVHEGGFACEKSGNGEVTFRDRSQRPLPTYAELPRVASDEALQRWLDNAYLEAAADGDGCDAKWYAGDRIDWHMAVDALFSPS